MAELFTFELVSPERLLLSVSATQVVVPGSEGYMTIMANHSPVMTTLKPGLIEATHEDGTTESYFVRGGLADVAPTGFTVLAEFAVPKSEVTSELFAEQKQLAQEEFESAQAGDDEDKKTTTSAVLEQLKSLEPTLLSA